MRHSEMLFLFKLPLLPGWQTV